MHVLRAHHSSGILIPVQCPYLLVCLGWAAPSYPPRANPAGGAAPSMNVQLAQALPPRSVGRLLLGMLMQCRLALSCDTVRRVVAMSGHLLVLYLAAVFVVMVTPGPDMMFVLASGVRGAHPAPSDTQRPRGEAP